MDQPPTIKPTQKMKLKSNENKLKVRQHKIAFKTNNKHCQRINISCRVNKLQQGTNIAA